MNKLKEYRPFGVGDGTHYTYYIDNLRKSEDDTYFIWLDGNMVYEFTSSDSDTYTYGHRLLYSDDTKYVLNAHGDVVALLNDSGVLTKRYLNTNINYPKAENGASGSEYESSLHCGIPVHTYNGYGVSSVNDVLVYDSSHPC